PRGKPDPMIFLTAAGELGAAPAACFVAEDAVSGLQAAKAGGMSALGVARLGDGLLLRGAGADLGVGTLDAGPRPGLGAGPARAARGCAAAVTVPPGSHRVLSSWPVLQGVLPVRPSQVPRDLLAGVTLAALAIPQALGYAKIAGMPVVTGLYTMLLPMAAF